MEAQICCLCDCNLENSKGKNHKKKLRSCKDEFEQLQDCISETCETDVLLTDMDRFAQDKILCYQCLKRLREIRKLEKEIELLKYKIGSYAEKFLGIARKRPLQESSTPCPKRSRTQPRKIIAAESDSFRVSVYILHVYYSNFIKLLCAFTYRSLLERRNMR